MRSNLALILGPLLVLASGVASAGSATLACQSESGNIVFAVGNSKDQKVHIKYKEKKSGQVKAISMPVSVPSTMWGDPPEKFVRAVPVSNATYIFRHQSHLEVTHKDGTKCSGREFYHAKYAKTFSIQSPDGDSPLYQLGLIGETDIEGLTEDGYIVTKQICEEHTVTSPGGCFPTDPSDVVKEVQDE